MPRRWLPLVAWLGLLLFAQLGRAETSPLDPSPGLRRDARHCGLRNGIDLLAQFYALPEDAPLSDVVSALGRDQAELSVLLATVPEPQLGFDGAVEAITAAIEDLGYTLDRHALPWGKKADPGDVACTDGVPGRVLFVRPGAKRSLLLLHLISESPTGGIARPAFLVALAEQAAFRAALPAERCVECGAVRLVAPAFSGSVASLEQLLRHPQAAGLSFRLISGRATDQTVRDRIQRHTTDQRSITYQATVIPDDAMQRELFCYLTETLGIQDHEIALLVESSTQYGRAAASWHDREEQRPDISKNCQRAHRPRLVLPVPLHVAQLSSAAIRTSSFFGLSRSDGDSKASASALSKLSVGERGDMLPKLSPQTVATTERSLSTVLSTLVNERIRYVGLFFTDPQDTLFLADQVRRFAPDIALFTFQADILYTDPAARPFLKGMLVVSPYPLFNRNQIWSFPFRGHERRRQFGRDVDEGTYNAVLAQLGQPAGMLEYSQPIGGSAETPDPRPPIWISAVGIDTLFPLTYIRNYDPKGYVYERPALEVIHKPHYVPNQQGALTVLLFGLGGVAALLALGYFRCYHVSSDEELPAPFGVFRFFQRSPRSGEWSSESPPATDRRALFVLSGFLPMSILYPFLVTAHFIQLRNGNRSDALLGSAPMWKRMLHHLTGLGVYDDLGLHVLMVGVCATLFQLAILAVTVDSLLCFLGVGDRVTNARRRFLATRPWLRAVLLGLALGLAEVLLFGGFVLLVNALQTDFANMIYLRRAAQPSMGLSPFVPFVVLVGGFLLWGYNNLSRLRLGDGENPGLRELIRELSHSHDMSHHMDAIARHTGTPRTRHYLVAVGLAIVLALGVFDDVISLEGGRHGYNFLFRCAFALLCVMITYGLYRFVRLWQSLAAFLECLAHHPLLATLGRLPDALARSIGSLFLEPLPEHARRAAERQQVILLQAQIKALPSQPASPEGASTPQLQERLAEVCQQLESKRAVSPANGDVLTPTDLAWLSTELAKLLAVCWEARPFAAATSTTTQTGQPTSPLQLALNLAEEFLAMQLVTHIHRLFPYLRNTLVFLSGGLIVLLGTLISYPFQPQHFLMLVMWVLILASVGLITWVLINMSRDEVLSRASHTSPGKVTYDRQFVSRVIVYGLLPLLSLLASQFPEVRGVAFSWLESILKTFK